MIAIVGEEIQREVTRRASNASMFAVMMDETTDVSRKEQVSIFVRYVNESSSVDCKVEERLLALIDAAETTGEALAALLIGALEKHNLNVNNVGQGYEGGSIVELLFTFVEGSAARHAYFVNIQKQFSPDEPALHLKALSDTRWNCRVSSLQRLSTKRVFRAAIATIEHISTTTTDGSIRGTAAGLLSSVLNFKFLLSLELLTPVLQSINVVSQYLQSSTVDILNAQQQVAIRELQRLRDEEQVMMRALKSAESIATKLGIEGELPVERQRKLPRRLDDNPLSAASLSPLERMKTCFYYPVMDKLLAELRQRFPADLLEFAFLDPKNFAAIDGEEQVRRLAARYNLCPDSAASQWRLLHQFVTSGLGGNADMIICL